MAQPNKYNPQIRFSNSPYNSRINRIDPVELDNELKNISESIGDIVQNIALIQRDDGFIVDSALGEYQAKIESEVISKAQAAANRENQMFAATIRHLVIGAVNEYIKTLKFDNSGSPIPTPNPIPIGTTEFDLLNILRLANDASDYAYLEEGTYKITSQIRITPTEYPNLKGIVGKGKGKTVITFDWAQKFDWDSKSNETDARSACGILVDGVHNKTLKDFSIRYDGEFYRKGQSYFGCVSCINIQNSNNNLVDAVEASGANRAGIFLGATSDALKQENAAVKNGTLSVDSIKSHGLNNAVQNCHVHHNRVAGILIQNQVGTRVLSNTCEYNGHEADGGTGYGICAFSNSVNVGIKVIGNTTRKNYRKGIDSHDAYDYEVRDNRSEGDRFFGCAIESRGFPMRNIVVENNVFIQDGTFRLTLDDEHTDWTNHRNMDYYRYTAVRIENKSQASQPWKNQPDNVSIIIRNNNISGIEWDGRGIHRVIEIRNNEQATHVRLNCDVSGNTIKGKSVHNIFFGYSETTAYNGLGNFVLKNNNIDFDEIRDVPFSFQEKNQSGVTGGLLEVSGNTITTRKNDAWVNILNLECETRPLIKFNGNTINMPSVTKQQIRLVSSAGASKMFFEVMNNIWNTASTAEQVKALFITRNTVPAENINVYNNRVKDSNGDIITYDGAITNATPKDPANPSTQPGAPVGGNIWEDSYTLPTATVTAPDSSIVLNWSGATADSVPSSDGRSIVVQAGGYPPTGWASIVDTAASPKYMRSRLQRGGASAGVYPRLKMNKATTSISTIIFPMKIVSLGTSSRITTGLPIIGFGKTENEVDSAISGGAVAIQGSDATKFKFTKKNGIYVDGKPYNLEELSIGKTYIIALNAEPGATYINFGAAWNGNGQVSADTFEGVEIHNRSLSPAETIAASLRAIAKAKPDLVNGGSGSNAGAGGTGGGVGTGDNSNTQPGTTAPVIEKNAVFSMASANTGDNTVAADSGSAVLTSVKAVEERQDSPDWGGMVVTKNTLKGARALSPVNNSTTGRYVRIDNVAVGDEPSAIIFPFIVENTGDVNGAPLVITLNGNTPVSVGSAKLADDRLGWYATVSNGFTVNGQIPKPNVLLKFDTVYIGMIKQSKAFDSVRFGTNHVLNIWRNMIVAAGAEVCTGLSDLELNAKVDALKSKYNIEN